MIFRTIQDLHQGIITTENQIAALAVSPAFNLYQRQILEKYYNDILFELKKVINKHTNNIQVFESEIINGK